MPRERNTVPKLERHPNGVWYAFWYDAAERRTRRESMETKDDNEAIGRFARWLVEGPRGARLDGPAGITVAQALDWYYEKHVKPNVVDKERQANAIAHLRAFFDHKPLASIDIAASRAYTAVRREGIIGGGARRRDTRGSDSTIRRELNVLVAAARVALKWKRITADRMPSVELPAETKGGEVKWLTKEQLRLALNSSTGLLHDFILIAYYTAARRHSVEYLAKSQVDLRHGVIDLQPSGGAVTKKRRPKVPIFPEIRPTVERLMDGPGTYLIGVRQYRPFCELMGRLDIEAHPHMLRHSRATHMLLDGENPYKVAKLLGDTLKTVERVYGHYDVDFLNTASTIGEVA